jgi:excisionase family DNA binding protein
MSHDDSVITCRTPGRVEPRLGRSVSLEHAARLLQVSRRTIYYRIRAGRLRTIRTLGGSQRVLLDSLLEQGFQPQAFPTSSVASLSDRSPTEH